jgi:hypothetical protein
MCDGVMPGDEADKKNFLNFFKNFLKLQGAKFTSQMWGVTQTRQKKKKGRKRRADSIVFNVRDFS